MFIPGVPHDINHILKILEPSHFGIQLAISSTEMTSFKNKTMKALWVSIFQPFSKS